MFLSCGFPSIVAGGRRSLIFVDIGSNYNADDFESFATGIIDLGTVIAAKWTDFELYDETQTIGFTFYSLGMTSHDFEILSSGEIYHLPSLSPFGPTSLITGSGITNTHFLYAGNFFENLEESTITTLPPASGPYGSTTHPSGGILQIYI